MDAITASLGIILFGVMLAVGGGAFRRSPWGSAGKARKRLDRGPTTLEDGAIATLTGVVRSPGEPLEAPLSGKPCVLYKASGRVMGKAGNPTVLVADIDEARMIAFELETSDGVVRIEGDRADTDLPDLPLIPRRIERETAFMSAHDQSPEYLRYSSFREVRVEAGMTVRVQGMVVVDADPDAATSGYRDGSRKVKLVAHANHPLTIGRAR